MTRYSSAVEWAWQLAAAEAGSLKCTQIHTDHLLLGICSLERVVAKGPQGIPQLIFESLEQETVTVAELLKQVGTTALALRRAIRSVAPRGDADGQEAVLHRNEHCKLIFSRATDIAVLDGSGEVACTHLLQAILEDPGEQLGANLANFGVRLPSSQQPPEHPQPAERTRPQRNTPFLNKFGVDLTELAARGKLPPVIGRREEMLAAVRILGKLTKNNPLLIGEAGVGKTAIVEGLAGRIAAGKSLSGKRIIEVNLARLTAGTGTRGEFEERLTGLIDEASANPDLIIFIDEIHTMIGAGAAQGSLDAANILKPALARGALTCIGATTTAEYRRYFEKDAALTRRFEPILVKEPSPEEALELLEGLVERYEKHHLVQITGEALKSAVDLSIRYMPDRQLPDKALDVLDTACVRVKTPTLSVPLCGEDMPSVQPAGPVTRDVIAAVVSEKSGVPVAAALEDEAARLLHLEDFLRERVIGQEEAVERVAARVRIARAGLKAPRRPVAVMLFLGPTGVGKTQLAKSLAEFLFGSEDNLIRLDMSEFKEKHSVAKLIGAPPGYVGYDDQRGQLTDRLRTKPYCVVLMDEIEKAHPEVFDLFLQVFDEGRLTDSKGRTVMANNAIFIMTSNLSIQNRLGFRPTTSVRDMATTLDEAQGFFRPEFINRIDEQIVFRQLTREHVKEIAQNCLRAETKRLYETHGIFLTFNEDALELILREGYDVRNGVRELKRSIERLVDEPLSVRILEGGLQRGSTLVATSDGEKVTFRQSVETI